METSWQRYGMKPRLPSGSCVRVWCMRNAPQGFQFQNGLQFGGDLGDGPAEMRASSFLTLLVCFPVQLSLGLHGVIVVLAFGSQRGGAGSNPGLVLSVELACADAPASSVLLVRLKTL